MENFQCCSLFQTGPKKPSPCSPPPPPPLSSSPLRGGSKKLGFLSPLARQDEPQPGNPGEAAARGGGARGHRGAQDRRGLPGLHDRVRGQLELPDREHHLHRQGRQGVAAGARVHQGEQGQVHDHTRHAQERAHVQATRGQDKGQGVRDWCWPWARRRHACSGCWWSWRWSSCWRRTGRCATREEIDLSRSSLSLLSENSCASSVCCLSAESVFPSGVF